MIIAEAPLEQKPKTTVSRQVTGSQAIMDVLIQEGVKTIFGYPGGAIMRTV